MESWFVSNSNIYLKNQGGGADLFPFFIFYVVTTTILGINIGRFLMKLHYPKFLVLLDRELIKALQVFMEFNSKICIPTYTVY